MAAYKDGFPQLPAGAMISGRGPWGGMRFVVRALPLSDLLNWIDLGRPILDKTGLTAKYDFAVEFSAKGLNFPVPPGSTGGGPSPLDTSPVDGGPSI
jgi:uncharacterized protein (TIGR03435 family)